MHSKIRLEAPEALETRLNLSLAPKLWAPGLVTHREAPHQVQTYRGTIEVKSLESYFTPPPATSTPTTGHTETPGVLSRSGRNVGGRIAMSNTVIPASVSSVTPSVKPSITPSVTPSVTTVIPAAPDPLAELVAQLHGDGIHDDSGVIQAMIDTASLQGIKTITLPAGTFDLQHTVWFHGTDVTLTGQGSSTILQVDNYHTGVERGVLTDRGRAFTMMPEFDTNFMMLAARPTADTIVLRGPANVQAGQTLYLANGRGSTAVAEANLGGTLVADHIFNELDGVDYIQVGSVSTDKNGNTVLHLATPLQNVEEYFNVSPDGAMSDKYLHVKQVLHAADNLTLQNFSIVFKEMKADTSIYVIGTQNATVQNISVLNSSQAGGEGSIGLLNDIGTTLRNFRCPTSDIWLNNSRYATIADCTSGRILLEEQTTDALITHNTLVDASSCGLRTNDMTCARITFSDNNLAGGGKDTGAIAIFEGTDITIANNTIANVGNACVWLGKTRGSVIQDNIASAFYDFDAQSGAVVHGNNWQK